MLCIYRIYSIRHFEEAHLVKVWDNRLAKEMIVYSGWDTMGNLAVTLSGQGLSLVMNTFFGPVINAAMSISGSVNSYVMQFVGNFQTAANPQITKLYANNEIENMNRLVENTSKFSGYIVLYFAIPLILNIHLVLKVWLGHGVPDYTAEFTQVILVQSVIFTMGRPLVTEMHAIGKMKVPNLCNGTVLLLILPMSYLILKLGYSPIIVYCANVLPWIFQILFENWFVNHQTAQVQDRTAIFGVRYGP
jgi:Na+-driven multidrug efflux pump